MVMSVCWDGSGCLILLAILCLPFLSNKMGCHGGDNKYSKNRHKLPFLSIPTNPCRVKVANICKERKRTGRACSCSRSVTVPAQCAGARDKPFLPKISPGRRGTKLAKRLRAKPRDRNPAQGCREASLDDFSEKMVAVNPKEEGFREEVTGSGGGSQSSTVSKSGAGVEN